MDEVTAITQTVLRERQGRDRGWWERMRSCFVGDATVRLSWFDGTGDEFVDASEAMVARGSVATHRLGPPVVDWVGERAVVELPAVIGMREWVDGVEADLASATRLYYRLRRRGGDWLVVSLDVAYERDTLTAVQPGQVLRIDPAETAQFRPSYRFLSYVLTRRGFPVAGDLYGDDRPEPLARFYGEVYGWLRAG